MVMPNAYALDLYRELALGQEQKQSAAQTLDAARDLREVQSAALGMGVRAAWQRQEDHRRSSLLSLSSSPADGELAGGSSMRAPAIAVVVIFIGYPLGSVVYHAFTRWDGLRPAAVDRAAQLQPALARPDLLDCAIRNNAIFAISVPDRGARSRWSLAYLIHERVPGWRFFRSAFFLPAIYSTVVVGIIASRRAAAGGPAQQRCSTASGSAASSRSWLENSGTATRLDSSLVVVWANFGYSVLIYLAGMSAIDPQLRRRLGSTVPGSGTSSGRSTRPTCAACIELVFVINTITAFAYMLPYIYTMTGGGPGYDTYVTEFYIYDAAFQEQHSATPAAIGVVARRDHHRARLLPDPDAHAGTRAMSDVRPRPAGRRLVPRQHFARIPREHRTPGRMAQLVSAWALLAPRRSSRCTSWSPARSGPQADWNNSRTRAADDAQPRRVQAGLDRREPRHLPAQLGDRHRRHGAPRPRHRRDGGLRVLPHRMAVGGRRRTSSSSRGSPCRRSR